VGYAGKKVKGREIHALVDTEGLPMRVIVHSAAIQDRDGAGLVLDKIRRRFPWLEMIWADGGYNAWQVDAAVAKVPPLRMEIVKRNDDMEGFVVPRRWVVERTFSWPKPASCQRLREPCRNPGHLRCPRLHPTGPQAARQGVGRDGGGLQSMNSRPSPTPGPAAESRRFQPFANRDKIASGAPKRCLALLGSLAATGAQSATKRRLGGERLLRR
jgi:transposase